MFEYLTEGLPPAIFKGQKISITGKGIVACDIRTGEILPWEDFLRKHLGEIRDYKIDLIFKD